MRKISTRLLGVALAAAATLPLAVAGVAVAEPAPIGGGHVSEVIPSAVNKSVAVDGLRIRSEPGYDGWVIGQLYAGDRVFIRETFDPSYDPSWVGVVLVDDSPGGLKALTRGYVHVAYLH